MSIQQIYLSDIESFVYYNENELPISDQVGIKNLQVVTNHGSFVASLDERFNVLSFPHQFGSLDLDFNTEIRYLSKSFDEIKRSDFRYQKSDGLEGTETLTQEIFINYLKNKNRDSLINKITND